MPFCIRCALSHGHSCVDKRLNKFQAAYILYIGQHIITLWYPIFWCMYSNIKFISIVLREKERYLNAVCPGLRISKSKESSKAKTCMPKENRVNRNIDTFLVNDAWNFEYTEDYMQGVFCNFCKGYTMLQLYVPLQ